MLNEQHAVPGECSPRPKELLEAMFGPKGQVYFLDFQEKKLVQE